MGQEPLLFAGSAALKDQVVDPSLGAANYIIGCLPVYKRFLLWFGGVRGDRERGMEQLQRAAELGRYLGPMAKVARELARARKDGH